MVASIDDVLPDGLGQQVLDALAQPVAVLRRHFHQYVPGMRSRKRIAHAVAVANGEFDDLAHDQFEAGDRAAGARLRQMQELERRRGRGHADKGGLHRARTRKQLEHRRGDDAERAFSADEDVPQVVAGVVLFQLLQQRQDAPIGQHHFQPEHQVARDAVSQRAGAAGIGREVAADGAASLGAERQREQPVDIGRGFLRLGQHHAGLAGHGVGGRIDLADLVETGEREDQFAVERNLSADQAGIAALRHQRRTGLVGELEDRRYFADRAGPQQHRGTAVIEAAAFYQERRERRRIGDGVFLADDGCKARQQVGGGCAVTGRRHAKVPARTIRGFASARGRRSRSRR